MNLKDAYLNTFSFKHEKGIHVYFVALFQPTRIKVIFDVN